MTLIHRAFLLTSGTWNLLNTSAWRAFQKPKNRGLFNPKRISKTVKYLTSTGTGTLRRIKWSASQPIAETCIDLTEQFINQTRLSGQDCRFGIQDASHRCPTSRINIIVIKGVFHGIVSIDAWISTWGETFVSSSTTMVNRLSRSSVGASNSHPFFRWDFSVKFTVVKEGRWMASFAKAGTHVFS